MLEFSSLSSYLWTACFAFHLYQLICRESADPAKFEPWYHLLCWGVPLAFDGYIFARQMLGYSAMGDADRPW